jgi:hypothetical protein
MSTPLDRITRIMTQRLVLDPPSDLVDGPVRQPNHVPVVDHQGGIGEVVFEGSAIAGRRIQRCQPDVLTPVRTAVFTCV